MEEELIQQFKRQATISGYGLHGSHFHISFDACHERVLAQETIPRGACIGEIFGKPAYIWDMNHCGYLFIDDDLVVDVTEAFPKQILTLIRDDNQSEYPSNCEMIVEHQHQTSDTSIIRFFLIATRNIYPGEELVYEVQTRM